MTGQAPYGASCVASGKADAAGQAGLFVFRGRRGRRELGTGIGIEVVVPGKGVAGTRVDHGRQQTRERQSVAEALLAHPYRKGTFFGGIGNSLTILTGCGKYHELKIRAHRAHGVGKDRLHDLLQIFNASAQVLRVDRRISVSGAVFQIPRQIQTPSLPRVRFGRTGVGSRRGGNRPATKSRNILSRAAQVSHLDGDIFR